MSVVPTARHTCVLGQLTEKSQGSFSDDRLTAGGSDHFPCASVAMRGPNLLFVVLVIDSEPMNWPTATHDRSSKHETELRVLVAVGLDVFGAETRVHFIPTSLATEIPAPRVDCPTPVQEVRQTTPESPDA
jgi:hypothetical protein